MLEEHLLQAQILALLLVLREHTQILVHFAFLVMLEQDHFPLPQVKEPLVPFAATVLLENFL